MLLAFAPLVAEDNHGAQNYLNLIEHVISLFGKSLSNVVAPLGNNCNTNKFVVWKAKIHFSGCASHRFSLVMKDILMDHKAPSQRRMT